MYRLISIALLWSSCHTASPPPCIIPHHLVIRWGIWTDSLHFLEGYQLVSNGRIVRYYQSSLTADINIVDTLPARVPITTHCEVVESLRRAFLRNQTYVVLGPVSHYVELTSSTSTLRAVWDSRFQTYGSREFRAIFRWLNSLAGVDTDASTHR